MNDSQQELPAGNSAHTLCKHVGNLLHIYLHDSIEGNIAKQQQQKMKNMVASVVIIYVNNPMLLIELVSNYSGSFGTRSIFKGFFLAFVYVYIQIC